MHPVRLRGELPTVGQVRQLVARLILDKEDRRRDALPVAEPVVGQGDHGDDDAGGDSGPLLV